MLLIKNTLVYIMLAGICLLAYALTQPYYNNEAYKQALDDKGMKLKSRQEMERYKVYYYQAINDIKTDKPKLMDIAFGIIVASVTVYGFIITNRINKQRHIKQITTLSKRNTFILANGMWLLLIPGAYWYYLFRSGRGDYPWFADDMSAPIGNKVTLLLYGWVLVNMLLIMALRNSKMPAHLFIEIQYAIRSLISCLLFLMLFLGANNIYLLRLIVDGDHIAIVVSLFFSYIMLSLRAGKINAYKYNKEHTL